MKTLVTLLALAFSFPAHAYTFGYRGQDGTDGRSGDSGRDGYSQSVVAQGQPMDFDLRGGDGGDGDHGYRGRDASNCQQPLPNYNISGADGGQGGRGGSGGYGGDGGVLTVYYQNVGALAAIRVDASPGRGGNPGYAAEGGRPCYCQQRSWVGRECWTEKDPQGNPRQVCRNKTFYCQDGREGGRGEYGRNGQSGQPGYLKLINRLTPLEPEKTAYNLDFSRLHQGPFALSKHSWKYLRGALSLLRPGSRVDDEYLSYDGSQSWSVSLSWNNRRPTTIFAGAPIRLAISGGKFTYAIGDEATWAEAADRNDGQGNVTVALGRVVRAAELGQFTIQASGTGKNAVATLKDAAEVTDQVDTRLHLRLRSHGFIFAKTVYDAELPANRVELRDHVFTVRLGDLPIDAKYLDAGSKLTIQLTATQSLGGRAKATEIELKTKL